MTAQHGNTPAAWTAVVVALVGFLVGGVGLMFDPVSMTVFWVGVALTAGAGVLFLIMSRMGLHHSTTE
jgi:cyanate permease